MALASLHHAGTTKVFPAGGPPADDLIGLAATVVSAALPSQWSTGLRAVDSAGGGSLDLADDRGEDSGREQA